MKIKRLVLNIITIMLACMISMTIVGCGESDNKKDPNELIEKEYADMEFTISFSSETLDTPLEDMVYSSRNIPLLPTPIKVGYIFEGWFFDSNFSNPYTDGSLKLIMDDVVLYPKWQKEKFVHNGTYDIEFTTKIIEDTVKKGAYTDAYGGYGDFGKALRKDFCHIEKSDDNLLLRLEFDAGTVIPLQAAAPVYTVTINDKMNTDIRITDKIDSLSDTIKTVFIRINEWDMSTTLYLDIVWVNFENENLTEENRYETTTKYQMALDITKIIGFSEAFADSSKTLEEGYYLAKSYFRKENNEESMGSMFNPVYSYVYSDGNKNYKLIKQNMPYLGLVAQETPLKKPLINNFYHSLTCFVSTLTAFDIDCKDKDKVTHSDYFPRTYNGGYFRPTVTEFHADTGRFYNIIDLDKDLRKEYIALTAISGYMEREEGMGYIRQILSIDYDNLIKLPECDYAPLEGEVYEYNSNFNFYPGDFVDLNNKNLTYDSILEYGMSIEMPNFFYSIPKNNSKKEDKIIHSSRIEVVPTKETSAMKVCESQYKIGEFEVSNKIYGYDSRNRDLYMDRMSPQSFEGKGYNCQLRDVRKVKTGKNCINGETIYLEELFMEKVNRNIDFNIVNFKAFHIKNGEIDFSKQEILNGKKIVFEKDIAIEFSFKYGNNNIKTIVELKNLGKPHVDVFDDIKWTYNGDGHYVINTPKNVGDKVSYPKVQYTWGEEKRKFIDNFYGNKEGKLSINPSKIMRFALNNGYYRLDLPISHVTDFKIEDRNVYLIYELNNEFNEREFIYFDYLSDPQVSYIIEDENENIIIENNVEYIEDTNVRINVHELYTGKTVYDKFTIDHFKNYTHTENGKKEDYHLVYYDIYSNNGSKTIQYPDTPQNMANNVNEFLKDKAFGSLKLVYVHNNVDELVINYLYKVTFDGRISYKMLDEKMYFTDTTYKFAKSTLIGSDMSELSSMRVSINKYIDGKPSKVYEDRFTVDIEDDGSQYEILFKVPGTFKITVTYYVDSHIMNNNGVNSEKFVFEQMINVKSKLGKVKIIFKTDEYHPFKGGTTERIKEYSLTDGIVLLNFNKDTFDTSLFPSDNSKFPYDRSKDALYGWSVSGNFHGEVFKKNQSLNADEFVKKFDKDVVELKAIWESRFRINCKVNGNDNIVISRISDIFGNYVINFPYISEYDIPEGYEFIGWTGGVIGSSIIDKKTFEFPYSKDYYDKEKYGEEFYTVYAVFRNKETGITTTTPGV